MSSLTDFEPPATWQRTSLKVRNLQISTAAAVQSSKIMCLMSTESLAKWHLAGCRCEFWNIQISKSINLVNVAGTTTEVEAS